MVYNYDIAVAGAGAAGLMASVTAASLGKKVVLIEKNNMLGKKLLVSGKKRCNITNHAPDVSSFIDAFGKKGRFLHQSLDLLSIDDTIAFFNNHGLATVVERGQRVFPASGRSKDVVDMFTGLLRKYEVALMTGVSVKEITVSGSKVGSLVTDGMPVTAGSYIICTGGRSFPGTGSTGDGMEWARSVGHTIIAPRPALVPILSDDPCIRELNGLKLKNVRVEVHLNNKKQDERFGEAEFDATGLAGPVILDMSKRTGELLEDTNAAVSVHIDLKPALDHGRLDKRLIRDFTLEKNRRVADVLRKIMPAKLIPVILQRACVPADTPVSIMSKSDRKKLLHCMKDFAIKVTSPAGFDRAIVTSGGISLDEIEPGTMRSKLYENLFFAGEVLDLDGPTGGYNLQACWSTGYAAGLNA